MAIFLVLAAVGSLSIGAARLLGLQCSACMGGALSAGLPWLGFVFYGILASVAFRCPNSRFLRYAAGLTIFIHALLVTDMVLTNRLCIGCLGIAALAAGSATCLALKEGREIGPLLAAVICGSSVGFMASYDRIDEALTRLVWPARLLEQVPAWVDRESLRPCGHGSAVRVILYERDCKKCGSVAERLAPDLRNSFGPRVCLHPYSLPHPPIGSRLPLMIVAAKGGRIGIVEGSPMYSQLLEMIGKTLNISPESSATPIVVPGK